MKPEFDVAIIGAGPAGASCGLWLKHLGFNPIIFEASNQVGGLSASNPFDDIWNISLPVMSGNQVALQMEKNLIEADVPVYLNHQMVAIEPYKRNNKPMFTVLVRGQDGSTFQVNVPIVVIATGVEAKGLNIDDSFNDIKENVLIGPGKHMQSLNVKNKKIAVLGGGDNAFENALMFKANGAKLVDIYARTIKAQKKWCSQLSDIAVYQDPYVIDSNTLKINKKAYDYVTVFYGWKARLDGLQSLNLNCNEQGYIQTAWPTAQTNVLGVYAIGEVANRQHPCAITAMADGVVAAKDIQRVMENK